MSETICLITPSLTQPTQTEDAGRSSDHICPTESKLKQRLNCALDCISLLKVEVRALRGELAHVERARALKEVLLRDRRAQEQLLRKELMGGFERSAAANLNFDVEITSSDEFRLYRPTVRKVKHGANHH